MFVYLHFLNSNESIFLYPNKKDNTSLNQNDANNK